MPNDDYVKRSDCLEAIKKAEKWWWNADDLRNFREIFERIPAADVELKREWIPVTDDSLPDEDEEVQVYDGCYRVAKIEKGISVNERERMKRGEIPDPEEWGWNVARGYFRIRRSEVYKACDEQGNNEKPYCWRVDNGHGTLFGQDVKYWMPLPEPPKEEDNDKPRKSKAESQPKNGD